MYCSLVFRGRMLRRFKDVQEIGGKRYCDDFVGYKAMRTVYVEGKGR